MILKNTNNFPVGSLPSLIRNSVLEAQANMGFPIPLIVSSKLGAVAAALQNMIDVELPYGQTSPVALFYMVVAGSGEGKSSVDQNATMPLRYHEEKEATKYELKMARYLSELSCWNIENSTLEAAIRKNRKKSIATHDPVQIELIDKEFDNLQKKLESHFSRKPQQPLRIKLFHSNTTPIKLASDLHECVPTAYLTTDEGGSFFRGESLKDLGMLNKLWDGSTLEVDRSSSPSFKVHNARLSIFIGVQPEILQEYLHRRGRGARDSGFFARCLIAIPPSTKGTRFLNSQPKSWEHLTRLQQRLTAILTQDQLEMDQARESRHIIKFSREAKELWFHFRNQIELDLNPGGYLDDVTDGASKIAINAARMAALFHVLDECEGEISAHTFEQARAVCAWYLLEFKRLFSKNNEIPEEVSDAYELELSLVKWCNNHPVSTAIKKSAIQQFCPNHLRKKPQRREDALNMLVLRNKIQTQLQGKTEWVVFNPDFFPVPRVYAPVYPSLSYSPVTSY